METVTIVAFLWGEWFSRGEEYLEKLEAGIRRNTSYPLEFICLRDPTANISKKVGGWKFLPLNPPSLKKNLRKLGLYNPANAFHGRLFAVDLDILIVGSLDDIFGYSGELCIKAKHQYANENSPLFPDGDLFLHNIDPERWKKIWRWIKGNIHLIELRTQGKERIFYKIWGEELWPDLRYLQEEFPGQIRSYKKDKIRDLKEIPENTRIVSFHGKKNKPHMIDWVKEYWK